MRSIDPRTAEPFGPSWSETTAEDLDRVCAAAAGAAPALRRTSDQQRRAYLAAIANKLDAHRAALVTLADAETALGEARLNGELTRTVFQLRFLGDVVASGTYRHVTISPPTDSPMGTLPDLRRSVVPVGPVAVFAASNFPFAFGVAGGDTASAIAAGCPVVVKTHPSHPGLSMLVADLMSQALADAGAPPGTFAVVHGLEAGTRLVRHPATTAVAFTGSQTGGRVLFDLACSRPDPIPFYGELGSLNPVVVTPAAVRQRAEQIGADWVASVVLGGGQFCTKPGLLLVPSDESEAVVASIASAITAAPAAVLLNGAIHGRFGASITSLRERTTLVAESTGDISRGFRARPMVVRTTVSDALQSPDVLEEIFGPVGVVLEYDSLDDVASLVARLGGSLTMSIHGEDADPDAAQLVDLALSIAGRVIWNGFPTGVAVSPAMQHGGPWPASTSPRDTSVGAAAIARFVRAVTFQSFPDWLLPAELRDS